MPFGGRRQEGELKRGGYLYNPVTLFVLPGDLLLFFSCFLICLSFWDTAEAREQWHKFVLRST